MKTNETLMAFLRANNVADPVFDGSALKYFVPSRFVKSNDVRMFEDEDVEVTRAELMGSLAYGGFVDGYNGNTMKGHGRAKTSEKLVTDKVIDLARRAGLDIPEEKLQGAMSMVSGIMDRGVIYEEQYKAGSSCRGAYRGSGISFDSESSESKPSGLDKSVSAEGLASEDNIIRVTKWGK